MGASSCSPYSICTAGCSLMSPVSLLSAHPGPLEGLHSEHMGNQWCYFLCPGQTNSEGKKTKERWLDCAGKAGRRWEWHC